MIRQTGTKRLDKAINAIMDRLDDTERTEEDLTCLRSLKRDLESEMSRRTTVSPAHAM